MLSLDAALAMSALPGALASETALVKRWLTEHGAEYLGFDFNMRVGRGAGAFDNLPEPYRTMAIDNSKRIIDVVAYRDRAIDLLEVKGRADPCAVGQIRVYALLWGRDHPQFPILNVGLICAILDDDMRYALLLEEVTPFVYPDLVGVIRRT